MSSSTPSSLILRSEHRPPDVKVHTYSHMQRDPSSYYLSPPHSSDALYDAKAEMMSTSHRGLPPPSSMDRLDRMDRVLPQPQGQPQADRGGPSNNISLGSMPNAPSQWTGQDESMRSWLHAKSEEDRRRQEEEKTKQEGIRLEQRKIEQSMLQDSLRGGIPPPMVPMVFASMGGANVSNMSLEWAQHYMTQMSLQQQQQQAQLQQQQHQQQQHQQGQIQSSPDQRRDVRLIAGPNPNPYSSQSMQPPSSQSNSLPSAQSTPNLYNSSSERPRPQQAIQAAPSSSNLRGTNHGGTLSRLNTNELQIQPPQAGLQGLQISGQHPLQQTQSAQHTDQPSSSPTIYFHHYVPPGTQAKDKEPGTPAMKNGSPHGSTANSHRRSDYPSPKKRKVGSDHKPPSEPSPPFSQHSSTSSRRRQRSRQPSDASTKGVPDYVRNRTDSSRQSFSEGESGRNSVAPETRSRYPAGSDGRETTNQASRGSSNRNSPQS